ncbi:MAG: DNA translocase FtsK 4TM domain-containing protein, partial [Mesorhizobium sp.]|nr:DNA translocase FtsK 4TM domain-containing protein [Mesorhizobium sp.]
MRSGSTSSALLDGGSGLTAFARRQIERLTGIALIVAAAAGVGSLATWNVADPSFSHATDNPVTNALGYGGAVFADIATQFFGLAALITLVPLVGWGLFMATMRGVDRLPRRALAWFGASILTAGVIGCIAPPASWSLPSGLGGVFGDLVLKIPSLFLGGYPTGLPAMAIGIVLAAPALWLLSFASGVTGRRIARPVDASQNDRPGDDDLLYAEDEDHDGGILAIGAIVHWWLAARSFVRRHTASRRNDEVPDMRQARFAAEPETRSARTAMRVEPGFAGDMDPRAQPLADDDDEAPFDVDDDEMPSGQPAARTAGDAQRASQTRVDAPAPRPVPGARIKREAQTSMLAADHFEMPP